MGTGIAACVVVAFAGLKASTGIAAWFSGQIPDLAKEDMIVVGLNALLRAM